MLAEVTESGALLLRVSRCECDSQPVFPPQPLGCQRCGRFGGALEHFVVDAVGVLLERVQIHPRAVRSVSSAYWIGKIELDSGPLIHALLDAEARPGDNVEGRIAPARGAEDATGFADRVLFRTLRGGTC